MPPTTLAEAAANRKNHFDVIRLVLAAMVIFHHSYSVLYKGRGPALASDPMQRITAGRADLGSSAVYGFFIISGFLIAASWAREPRLFSYLRKRAARIYPAFIAMIAFCVLVEGPLGAPQHGVYWNSLSLANVLKSALVLEMPVMRGVFPHAPAHSVNVSVWTIAYEFRCYLLLALLGMMGGFRRRGFVLALFGVMTAAFLWSTWGGAAVLHGRSIRFLGDLEFWPPLSTYFVAGTVAYLYREHIPYSRRWFLGACAGAVMCLVINVVALLPIFLGYITLYVSLLPHGDTSWARRFGDFSYGVYLYGWPAQQLLRHYFPNAWTPTRLSLVALCLSVLLAVFSWHLVEKQFLKRRLQPPRLASTTPPADATGTSPAATAEYAPSGSARS